MFWARINGQGEIIFNKEIEIQFICEDAILSVECQHIYIILTIIHLAEDVYPYDNFYIILMCILSFKLSILCNVRLVQ